MRIVTAQRYARGGDKAHKIRVNGCHGSGERGPAFVWDVRGGEATSRVLSNRGVVKA